jgi:LysR family transcriptional activator of nhaA
MYGAIMEWLNYHHLFYFWMVAKEGTIAAACKRLLLTQSTISAQLHALEKALGQKLFDRMGRNLVLTEAGRVVYRYAEQIFSMGSELLDAVKGRPAVRPLRLNIGAHDVLPKLVAYRLLEPVLNLPEPVHIVCYEGTPLQLLPRLAVREVDLVLTDTPIDPHIRVRAYSHLLGESGIGFYATPKLARRLRIGFPQSLHGAPALLPTDNTAIRRSLNKWFDSVGVRPEVVSEFEDSELMMVFGQKGRGFFPGHDVIEEEIVNSFDVEPIGVIEGHRERFYAVSPDRRPRHPAVICLTAAARKSMSRRRA